MKEMVKQAVYSEEMQQNVAFHLGRYFIRVITGPKIQIYKDFQYTQRTLHQCSCFIEFIKRTGEKGKNARLAEHLINFSQ